MPAPGSIGAVAEKLNRFAEAAVGLEKSLGEAVHEREEGQQVIDSPQAFACGAVLALAPCGLLQQLLATASERIDDGVNFAALALVGHQGEHVPDIRQRLVVI